MASQHPPSLDDALTYVNSRLGAAETVRILRATLFCDEVQDGRPLGKQIARLLVERADRRAANGA